MNNIQKIKVEDENDNICEFILIDEIFWENEPYYVYKHEISYSSSEILFLKYDPIDDSLAEVDHIHELKQLYKRLTEE
ncbi:hypothetical protein [Priestia megaterium]|uniref:hypothetical protein n=1 Tax=Priestia megaterium TaxID=1404 RepID=UPI001A94C623|nr:hypothetical protein [Priestia megaterium]QSX24193.1 hypothetical protein J0P05_31205 [Priestia megaterium]